MHMHLHIINETTAIPCLILIFSLFFVFWETKRQVPSILGRIRISYGLYKALSYFLSITLCCQKIVYMQPDRYS